MAGRGPPSSASEGLPSAHLGPEGSRRLPSLWMARLQGLLYLSYLKGSKSSTGLRAGHVDLGAPPVPGRHELTFPVSLFLVTCTRHSVALHTSPGAYKPCDLTSRSQTPLDGQGQVVLPEGQAEFGKSQRLPSSGPS